MPDCQCERLRGSRWWARAAVAVSLVGLIGGCTTAAPNSATPNASKDSKRGEKTRTSRYQTPQGFAQIAVDDPCEYLGKVYSISRELIDRLRGRGQITLDEWSCMADVIRDVNWQVGMSCHNGKVPFSEFAQHQEAGHRACIAEERRDHARCAVIQVSRSGRASFCR